MPPYPIRVAVVDEHTLFRNTLKYFLSDQPNITVPLQAKDMSNLFAKLQSIPIDILLMDIFLPDVRGVDAVLELRMEYPAIKILAFSMNTDLGLVSDLLDAGIHGYIPKTDEPECLLQAIIAASEGRIYRNRLFTEALYRNRQKTISVRRTASEVVLSDREKRILQLIWEEKSNKTIADMLFLSTRSVEKIRQDMKEKLDVKSTVGLLRYGLLKKILLVNFLPQLC
jgi:DNA-binding NarL/FixJ family response regulator